MNLLVKVISKLLILKSKEKDFFDNFMMQMSNCLAHLTQDKIYNLSKLLEQIIEKIYEYQLQEGLKKYRLLGSHSYEKFKRHLTSIITLFFQKSSTVENINLNLENLIRVLKFDLCVAKKKEIKNTKFL